MLLGAFAAIGQTNIKRLMAYCSIGHIGYALVGLAAGTELGVRGVLVYMAIYVFMNVGTFAVHPVRCAGRAGWSRRSTISPACRRRTRCWPRRSPIFMFSMAGIPPLRRLLRQALRVPGGDRRRGL